MKITKVAITVLISLSTVSALQADSIKALSFSGQAYVADLTNGPAELPNLPIGKTGPLPTEGCCVLTVEVPEIDAPGIISLKSAKASTAATTDDESKSKVKIKRFTLPFTTADGASHTLSFKSLEVEAGAECHDDGVDLKTEFVLEDLKLDGSSVRTTKDPNQTVSFAGGSLILNYQAPVRSPGYGEMTIAGIVLLVDGGLSGAIGFAQADVTCEPGVIFSGEASVADLLNAFPGGFDLAIGKTGPLPPEGCCEITAEVPEIDVPGVLSIKSAVATTRSDVDEAESRVTIKKFSLTFTTLDGATHTLSFDSLEIEVEAECGDGAPKVYVESKIEGLRLDGQILPVENGVNQLIGFVGGSLTINSVTSGTTSNSADISAAALFLNVDGGANGPIGFVHADVTCPPSAATP